MNKLCEQNSIERRITRSQQACTQACTRWGMPVTLTPCPSDCYCLVTKSSLTLSPPHGLQPAKLLCPRDFPGKNTGVGFHFLLQGIFPSQESNPCLLNWQASSLPLIHQQSSISMNNWYDLPFEAFMDEKNLRRWFLGNTGVHHLSRLPAFCVKGIFLTTNTCLSHQYWLSSSKLPDLSS